MLHHKIDPLEFNQQVDDALPLEGVITPDPALRRLLADIDRTKIKPWLFTNAYITHARRVVRLLGVEDMFEGITFCDYGKWPFVCKPHEEMFRKAEEESGASSVDGCYFIGSPTQNPPPIPPFLTKPILPNRRFSSQLPTRPQPRLDDDAYSRARGSGTSDQSGAISNPQSRGTTSLIPAILP